MAGEPVMTQTEWMLRASEIVHFARELVALTDETWASAQELRRLLPHIPDLPPPDKREAV
jgi:hypothetical protein